MASQTTTGTVINFGDIRHEVVKVISRSGHTFELRDDIPMEVLVRGFALKSVGERLQAAGGSGAGNGDEIRAAFEEADAETIPVVCDIFRHSYPETTDEEIAALFSMEERMQLIQVFFQRRLAQLQPQPDATSTDMAALAAALPEQAQPQTPNRAARRAIPSARRATTPRPPR